MTDVIAEIQGLAADLPPWFFVRMASRMASMPSDVAFLAAGESSTVVFSPLPPQPLRTAS